MPCSTTSSRPSCVPASQSAAAISFSRSPDVPRHPAHAIRFLLTFRDQHSLDLDLHKRPCAGNGTDRQGGFSMSAATIILIIVAVLAVAFAVLMYLRQERTSRLRTRYGPEYQRVIDEYGSRHKAEADLIDRQRRVEKFHIH